MKRINKNDLTFYFIKDHKQLPDAYLRSCDKFFKELSAKQQAIDETVPHCDIDEAKNCNDFFKEIKQIKNPAATYKQAVNNLKRKVKQ
jgi:hypothetical protein